MSLKHFPKSEFDARWKKAREEMRKSGLDALLVTDEQNYVYLSGHSDRATLTGKARPYIFVLPVDRDPVLILRVHQSNEARQNTWIEDIRTWSELPFNIDSVSKALIDIGLGKGRIGAEMGLESRLGITYNDFAKLQNDLPNAKFVDAASILQKMRMKKSEAEVNLIRKSCEIASRALENCLDSVKDGMTEREAIKILYEGMMQGGADMPGAAKTKRPTDHNRVLHNGDIFRIDTACVLNCYWSDIARMTVVGGASENQRKIHEYMWDLTRRCINEIRPGVRASSIVQFYNKEIEKGLPSYVPPLKKKDRLGHGVGIEPTEPPSISLEDQTILEPGMIIAMEPVVISTEKATLHIEDSVVVTENGNELLTTARREWI